MAVEAARPEQGRIEHVGAVRGRHDDDGFVLREAVHFAEDLVERLLAFVVAAAQAGAAMPAHGVDLVDEEDAGGVGLGGFEQVADAAGPDADEHLDELRAADGVEGDARLAGHGAAQQRLARARRADQEHPLGHAPAEPLELLRVLQELDDFLQFAFDAFQAGDVGEGDRPVAHFIAFGRALAEPAHQAAENRVPRAAEEEQQPGEQRHRASARMTVRIGPRPVARLGGLVVGAQLLRNRSSRSWSTRAERRQGGGELLLQLRELPVAVLLPLGIERRIDEFAGDARALDIGLGDIAAFRAVRGTCRS